MNNAFTHTNFKRYSVLLAMKTNFGVAFHLRIQFPSVSTFKIFSCLDRKRVFKDIIDVIKQRLFRGTLFFSETTGCFDIKAICDKDVTKIEQQNTLNTGIKNLFTSETPLLLKIQFNFTKQMNFILLKTSKMSVPILLITCFEHEAIFLVKIGV